MVVLHIYDTLILIVLVHIAVIYIYHILFFVVCIVHNMMYS